MAGGRRGDRARRAARFGRRCDRVVPAPTRAGGLGHPCRHCAGDVIPGSERHPEPDSDRLRRLPRRVGGRVLRGGRGGRRHLRRRVDRHRLPGRPRPDDDRCPRHQRRQRPDRADGERNRQGHRRGRRQDRRPGDPQAGRAGIGTRVHGGRSAQRHRHPGRHDRLSARRPQEPDRWHRHRLGPQDPHRVRHVDRHGEDRHATPTPRWPP